jgi:hypothetical protein
MRAAMIAVSISFLLLLLPLIASSKEDRAGAQVEQIAQDIVTRLPLDQKIVLKALSPEKSGLPEDFLRKLTSDFEAALLSASDFEINLTNRLTTEELWAEAVEFGDADFQELYEASRADVVLMLSPRATAGGVDVSVTAYRLLGDNAGQVIASSGSVVLAINMEESIGVDVNSLNDQMEQVLSEIEKIGQTGGLISGPNTYAEYYHNARLLQQRGEVDLAMRHYESALAEGFLFVDPLLDLLDLANARYGDKGTLQYFDKKLKSTLPDELALLAELQLEKEPVKYVEAILDGGIDFTPFLADWIDATLFESEYGTLMIGKAQAIASKRVSEDYRSGAFQSFYIDKIRGATVGQDAAGRYEQLINSGQLFIDRKTISRLRVNFARFSGRGHCDNYDVTKPDPLRGIAWLNRFQIDDIVDRSKPVVVCVRKNSRSSNQTCVDINSNGAHVIPPQSGRVDPSFIAYIPFDSSPEACHAFDFTIGMHCIDSVEYTDIHGFRVKSPVLINRQQRPEYLMNNPELIDECAGEFLRLRR